MKKPHEITDFEIYSEETCINLVAANANVANEFAVKMVFVEGPDDINLFGPHIHYLHGPSVKIACNDEDVVEVLSASVSLASHFEWRPNTRVNFGKKWVETQLSDPHYKTNKWLCKGIVDKDFDYAYQLESNFHGLIVTDTHDSETLAFSSLGKRLEAIPCFCIGGVFEQDKVSLALRLSFEFGLLKWVSIYLQESHYQGFFHNDEPRNERLLVAIKQVLVTTEDKKIPYLIDDVYASLIDNGHISLEKIFCHYAFSLAQERGRVSSTALSNKCLEEFFGKTSALREYASRVCVQKMFSCLSEKQLFSGVWMDSKGAWLTDEITFDNVLGGIGLSVFDVCNGHDLERFLQVEFQNPLLDLSGSLKDLALENLKKNGNKTPLFETHLFKKAAEKW